MRALNHGCSPEVLEKVVKEGVYVKEGRSKWRVSLKTKQGVIFLVMEEYADHTEIVTVGKGR